MSGLLDENVLKIFRFLDAPSLCRAAKVCKQWSRLARSPDLWRRLVLVKWPSQRFLYKSIGILSLNWRRVYQELAARAYFSSDDMKYFIFCKSVEDELIHPGLREAMFKRMSEVSQKWIQVYPYEHDEVGDRFFDKNLELYFDAIQLDWCFLDRRRGHIEDIFKKPKKSHHIRPYQVIPSCLIMYRWLCLFRTYATAEVGLTFYRIWRFRLRHLNTGIIFELCDWKAAMSSTFSNGCPAEEKFRRDALELLSLLSHPHFIMHPLGLSHRLERSSHYLVSASAGGLPNRRVSYDRQDSRSDRDSRKRNRSGATSPALHAVVSPASLKVAQPEMPFKSYSDTEDDLGERRRKGRRRKLSPFSPVASLSGPTGPVGISLDDPLGRYTPNPFPTLTPHDSNLSIDSNALIDRSVSCSSSSLSSWHSDTEEDRSERESDMESEVDSYDTGYVSNCEYFINMLNSLDIEEQHSLQASIADSWMFCRRSKGPKIAVYYDIQDETWFFENDFGIADNEPWLVAARCVEDGPRSSKMKSPYGSNTDLDGRCEERPCFSGYGRSSHLAKSNDSLAGEFSPPVSPISDCSCPSFPLVRKPIVQLERDTTDSIIEPIPSCLALYRLICLFDLNCSMYTCPNDVSVWRITMMHKKTGGFMHFQDLNGWFHVHVSIESSPPQSQENSGAESGDEETESTSGSTYSQRDGLVNVSEFRAAAIQLLDLLMDEKFSHPYGTVAGSVA